MASVIDSDIQDYDKKIKQILKNYNNKHKQLTEEKFYLSNINGQVVREVKKEGRKLFYKDIVDLISIKGSIEKVESFLDTEGEDYIKAKYALYQYTHINPASSGEFKRGGKGEGYYGHQADKYRGLYLGPAELKKGQLGEMWENIFHKEFEMYSKMALKYTKELSSGRYAEPFNEMLNRYTTTIVAKQDDYKYGVPFWDEKGKLKMLGVFEQEEMMKKLFLTSVAEPTMYSKEEESAIRTGVTSAHRQFNEGGKSSFGGGGDNVNPFEKQSKEADNNYIRCSKQSPQLGILSFLASLPSKLVGSFGDFLFYSKINNYNNFKDDIKLMTKQLVSPYSSIDTAKSLVENLQKSKAYYEAFRVDTLINKYAKFQGSGRYSATDNYNRYKAYTNLLQKKYGWSKKDVMFQTKNYYSEFFDLWRNENLTDEEKITGIASNTVKFALPVLALLGVKKLLGKKAVKSVSTKAVPDNTINTGATLLSVMALDNLLENNKNNNSILQMVKHKYLVHAYTNDSLFERYDEEFRVAV